MKTILIYIFLASVFSCLGNECDRTDVVNAANYEVKFHELFQQYWHNNRTLSNELKNTLKVLQQPNVKIGELPNISNPKICLMCRAFSYSMLTYYRNESNSNLNEYLLELCTHLTEVADHECHGLIDIYAPSIKYILKDRASELSADKICGIVFQECSNNQSLIDFKIQINREPLLKTPKTYDFDEKSLNSSAFITIAHFSDFHYDPYYAPGSSSDCIESICCRNTSIPKSNSTHKTGWWGDYHVCDSPGHLIENICSQAALNKNIDLIYYTGDFNDHFAWLSSPSTVKRTIEFITQQIKEKFPNIPVIMTIGNHDIHPSDAKVFMNVIVRFAPEMVGPTLNTKWLYESVADLWSDWLPQSALSTLRIGGYYSVQFRPGFRIIVLNNNLCWVHNIWLLYGANEMIAQLEWLRDTLISAETKREKVHILGHIPPNTSTCVRAWNREYNRLIEKFAHIISGQFNGHTHRDSFTLFYSMENGMPIPQNVAWIGGSGTSFVGLNSNYRLYTVELNTFEVIDFDTYIFNLTAANLTPDQSPKWFKEYTFREAFGITDLSPYTLSKLVNITFRHDRRALHKMWTYYHKMSDAKLAIGCNDNCLENLRETINSEHEDNLF